MANMKEEKFMLKVVQEALLYLTGDFIDSSQEKFWPLKDERIFTFSSKKKF